MDLDKYKGNRKELIEWNSKIKTDSYWIDGCFILWWSGNSYFSHDRQIFVPKLAILRIENNRIYIKTKYALAQMKIANNKYLNWSDKKDANLGLFVKALNKPWKKEGSILPPTSLPDF